MHRPGPSWLGLSAALVVGCSSVAFDLNPPGSGADATASADADVASVDALPSEDRGSPDAGVLPTDAPVVDAPDDVAVDVDAGVDAGPAPIDADTDVGSVPLDVGVDIGPAPIDVVAIDTGVDTGPAPIDVAVDLGVDTGPPPVDVPVDTGPSCASPRAVCGGDCVDLATDPRHCGACDRACAAPANADATCATGACGSACRPGYADCDRDPENGCETRGACAAPTDGLLLYYPLDGDGTETVRGANATPRGSLTAAVDRFGRAGGALQLTPTQYLATGSVSVLPQGRAPRSMCLWMRSRSNTSSWPYRSVAQWGSAATVGARWGVSTYWTAGATPVDRVIFTGQSADVETDVNVLGDAWHLTCVTYDGTTTTVWVDGESRASGSPALNTAGSVLVIGRPPGTYNSEYYGGFVDELRVWSRPLTRAEVRTMWNLR